MTEKVYNKTSGLACEWIKQLNMTSVSYRTFMADISKSTFTICYTEHLVDKKFNWSYIKVFIIIWRKLNNNNNIKN